MSNSVIQIFNLISKRTITEVGILFSYLKHHYKEFDCEDYFIIRDLLKNLEESYLENDFFLLYDINNNFKTEYRLLLLKSLEDVIKEYDKKKEESKKPVTGAKPVESVKPVKPTKKNRRSYASVASLKKNDSNDDIII